jgi:hypothetical protein
MTSQLQCNKIHFFGNDQVVEITAVEENGERATRTTAPGIRPMVKGYIYSGWIQPVETVYQKPKFRHPCRGQLGEITVPFSITRRIPSCLRGQCHRIYYGTTHWIHESGRHSG